MAPLLMLTIVTAALSMAGRLGVRALRPWPIAVCGGLAAMFLMTGIAHFVGMRAELVSMVPPVFPAPGLLVTITGILELAGAAGLLLPRTRGWAAGGLSLLLVVMFPANVYAAMAGASTGWHEQLGPRTAMQVIFLAAALAVLVHELRSRGAARRPSAPSVAAPS